MRGELPVHIHQKVFRTILVYFFQQIAQRHVVNIISRLVSHHTFILGFGRGRYDVEFQQLVDDIVGELDWKEVVSFDIEVMRNYLTR